MAKKKVCKKCRVFVEGNECQLCKGNQFSTLWQGRINVLDAESSSIAKRVGFTQKGEYSIKVR